MADSREEPNRARRTRRLLTPISREIELFPWRRATDLTRCLLYWIPVDSFPTQLAERTWLQEFFRRWAQFLKEAHGLREEVFFQFKGFYDLRKPFLNCQEEFFPVFGLSRRPNSTLPDPPSYEEISAANQEVSEAGKPPDFDKYMPDYCYWFAKKSAAKQRDLFLGHAVLTLLYLKPDTQGQSPGLPPHLQFLNKRPDLANMNLEGMLATAFSLKDGFLAKSKQLFGVGLEEEPQFKGLMYILPLLTTEDFLNQPDQEVEKWFQLFDVYVNESPADKGILLACKNDLEEPLIEILKGMKEDGFVYPER